MHFANVVLIASIIPLLIGGGYWWAKYETRSTNDWRDVLYSGAVVATVGAAVVIFAFGITSLVMYTNMRECREQAEGMNRDWKYGINAGCRVESDDGGFVPMERFRITNEEGDE